MHYFPIAQKCTIVVDEEESENQPVVRFFPKELDEI
jgi:hypothetical protein